ncbi:MAG TPA: EamA family transporter [Rhodanobacteraceae bacterium]|nr:EamA family transporter [Rhodanobacteraceae bacterium]
MNAPARARRRLWPVLLAWLALLSLETLCQISLKFTGDAIGAFDLSRASVLAALSTPWLWVAIGCYLGAFLAWMTILDKSALSAAFPTSALVFVSVMIASAAVFGEPVHWEKALGSAIIVAGILLLGGERAEHQAVHASVQTQTPPE